MKWLSFVPLIIGGFLFFGLYKHADNFSYYVQGAIVVAGSVATAAMIWAYHVEK